MSGPKPDALPLGDTPAKKECDCSRFFSFCQAKRKFYLFFVANCLNWLIKKSFLISQNARILAS